MTFPFLAFAFGYLCGSIPFGIIVTRLAGADDPRGIGSKNIGATNVLRTGRKDLAAITLAADALKGALAVFLTAHFDDGSHAIRLGVAAAAGAFAGHLYPLFLGFKGGKGVATFLGCLAALAWPAALVFVLTWIGVALLTRYSSAAALFASLLSTLAVVFLNDRDVAILFALLTAVLWVKHRANIKRLLAGSESKIGQKTSGQTT